MASAEKYKFQLQLTEVQSHRSLRLNPFHHKIQKQLCCVQSHLLRS